MGQVKEKNWHMDGVDLMRESKPQTLYIFFHLTPCEHAETDRDEQRSSASSLGQISDPGTHEEAKKRIKQRYPIRALQCRFEMEGWFGDRPASTAKAAGFDSRALRHLSPRILALRGA